MPPYIYELPTTGAFSFSEALIDQSGLHSTDFANATAARANVRAILKDSKRTGDVEKDNLRIIKALDDYLPHLVSVMTAVSAQTLTLRTDPVFSWRSTLSSHLFNSSPRMNFVSLHSDLAFTLLTYGFTLSNLSASVVTSLGTYEIERHITDVERQSKDERLNFAANLLCKASGIFTYIAENVLPEWEVASGPLTGLPPDLSKEVINALSKLALGNAQQLAIRRLMSKSAYDSTIIPGPPLPKSHPSPSLVAKLYINAEELYSSSRGLLLSANSEKSEVDAELRRHVGDQATLCSALAHKWLGVDAGEQSGKCGDAVAYLKWAKEELEGLRETKLKLTSLSKDNRKERSERKDRFTYEVDLVKNFLDHYQRLNDAVHFLPVPTTSEVQSRIPSGRAALAAKPFSLPRPKFVVSPPPTVTAAAATESSSENENSTEEVMTETQHERKYDGAGAYF
ncbi:hypothetical protein FRC02_005020 [Tulasnella sp. 418]|nr:hypothetical protein FRC02_005020 [Tulasnella sp. 418]